MPSHAFSPDHRNQTATNALRGSAKSGDPSLVSVSVVEMQRLIDIEHSAHVALAAMGTINLPNKHVTDATSALANALSNPALGG